MAKEADKVKRVTAVLREAIAFRGEHPDEYGSDGQIYGG